MSRSLSNTDSNTKLNEVCFITASTSSALLASMLLSAHRTSFRISFLGVSSSLKSVSRTSMSSTYLHWAVPEATMFPMTRSAGT